MSDIKFNETPILQRLIFFLMVAACAVYTTYLFQAIYVERALYADGANFFVELLSKERLWPIADDSKHIRLFVNVLNQMPMVLALKLGVTSLRCLRILFGAGLFLVPVIIYFYCYYLSRRANDYRALFFSVACLITCALPSDIFILNQAFTSLALAWVLIHYILLNLKIKWIDWFFVIFISIILFRAHESLILWGPIFSIGSFCIIFYRDKRRVDNKNLLVYTIGIIGVMQALFVAFWQYTHPVGEQTSAFLQLSSLLGPSHLCNGNTRISLLLLVAVFLIFITQYGYRKKFSQGKILKKIFFLGLILVMGLMLFTGFAAITNFNHTNPYREYSYRFLITFGSAGWMLLAIIFVTLNKPFGSAVRPLSIAVLSLGIISASFWQISNNIQWSIFTKATTSVLNNSSPIIIDPINVQKKLFSEGHENAYKYRWGWAWPVYGMSMQKDGKVEKLFRPEGFGDYFDPPNIVPFVSFDGRGLYKFDANITVSKDAGN